MAQERVMAETGPEIDPTGAPNTEGADAKLPLAGLSPQELQIVRQSIIDKRYSPEDRAKIAGFSHDERDQFDQKLDQWLAQNIKTPEKIEKYINSPLAESRRRQAEARAVRGTHVLRSMADLTPEQVAQFRQALSPQSFEELQHLDPETFQRVVGSTLGQKERQVVQAADGGGGSGRPTGTGGTGGGGERPTGNANDSGDAERAGQQKDGSNKEDAVERNLSFWDDLTGEEQEEITKILPPEALDQVKKINSEIFKLWQPVFIKHQRELQEARAAAELAAQTPKEPEPETPSPIAGLSQQDLELFLNSDRAKEVGATLDSIQNLVKVEGEEAVVAQIKSRAKALRENPGPTPEQKAQQEAQEKVIKWTKRIIEFGNDIQQLAELRQLPALTVRQKLFAKILQINTDKERQELLAGGGGEGPGEPGSPEDSPELPENDRLELEFEASPERGREIAWAIREQEALVFAGRIDEVDWPKLNGLYFDERIHVEAQRLVKSNPDIIPEEPDKPPQKETKKEINKEAFVGFRPLLEWITEYNQGGYAAIADQERFSKEIAVYFAEAEKVGLFKDLDTVLAAAWSQVRQAVGRRQSSTEVMPQINQQIQIALEAITDIFNGLARGDRNIGIFVTGADQRTERLIGVWDLYARFARERFAAAINNKDIEAATSWDYLRDSEGNIQEFELGEGEEEIPEETYWTLEHGWYLKVYARTEEEFLIAAESFISTAEQVTADPAKLIQEVDQFIDVIKRSEGRKKIDKVNPAFIVNLILGIEARVGIFGADNANELYNADHYKQFLDYINRLGRGPERYIELVKLFDAVPAAALWALDNDPRWEILFALYGSRGQLAAASPAQRTRDGDEGLYQQTLNLFIEEMMGIRMVNKADNLSKVTQFMSDKKFTSMFDGLYQFGTVPADRHGDANLKVYEEYLAQGITSEKDRRVPAAKRRAMRLGRIQYEVEEIRERLVSGEKLRTRDGKSYDPSKPIFSLLENKSDISFYQAEWDKTKKAVTIALQVYGVFGEKSKRGGGVFMTARKVDSEGNEYRYYVPIHKAEKFIQCGVTLTKIKYADNADIWKENGGYKTWTDEIAKKIRTDNLSQGQPEFKNFKAKYRTLQVEAAIARNIKEFRDNGYEAKLRNEDGSVMKIKKPQEDENGNLVEVNGKTVPIEVEADFYTATHHPYSNWTGHTYWSYQEEDRQKILEESIVKEALEVREGRKRWEDASMWAVQLLIIDPTLLRVRIFINHSEDRERKLTAAAVEDSYETHIQIGNELHRGFWPEYGTPTEDIGIYYGLQDFGGFRKTIENMRARIAEDPERFARRARRLLPDLRNPAYPLAEYLGHGSKGALRAVWMMDMPIYKGCGTFALDKFGANAELGGRVSDSLLGYRDREGNYKEGALLKPLNNSDKTRELLKILDKIGSQLIHQPVGEGDWTKGEPAVGEDIPDLQNKYAYAVIESLGRLGTYEQLLTVMETVVRNASGAMWLKNTDVSVDGEFGEDFIKQLAQLPDVKKQMTTAQLKEAMKKSVALFKASEDSYNKSFNKKEIDESRSPRTGSGRIGIKILHDIFGRWLVNVDKKLKPLPHRNDPENPGAPERSGVESYQGEELPYRRIFDKIVYWAPDPVNPGKFILVTTNETIWDFIFSKFVPT